MPSSIYNDIPYMSPEQEKKWRLLEKLSVGLYDLVEKKRDGEVHDRLEKSIKLVFFLGIPMVLGIDLIVKQFVPWFLGDGYDPVTPLVYYYSPLIICIGINNCLGEQYLTPIGKRKQTAIIVTVSAMMNFLLNLILIPTYNAMGASIASVFSEAFIAICYIVMSRKIICLKDYCRFSYKNIIAALIMFITIFVCTRNMEPNIVVSIVQIIGGCIVYIGTLLIIRDNFTFELFREVFQNNRGKRN